MTSSAPVGRTAFADYLAAEKASAIRHEFLDGLVYAMAGGTPEHGALAAAFIGELRSALRGKPCRVFTSDVRVRVDETQLATYPDASVVCGQLKTAADDPDGVANPILVVEVLSPATEAYDRGAKAAHYRRIPSLREYVLVAQDEVRVEVYRKNQHDRWELFEAMAGGQIRLESLGVSVAVDAVYENPLAGG
jgi:Uma2 family endonuclease